MATAPRTAAEEFRPYVPADKDVPEFTPKAVILGIIFGILFGVATVYLALRAGLTVSASIPIAVLAIAVFKKLGKSTILENNIVQTIGSAGESVAAGVAFTVPALVFLAEGEDYFRYMQITILAIFGGILGVLFMIPLRRALIVKEHGKLPYPEGTACAEVLVAGERGGNLAKMVFAGLFTAIIYKSLYGILGLWRETATFFRTRRESVYPSATLNVDVTPEYLGLGYIIGPKIASELFSGGLLSWMALIPLIAIFVPETRIVADLEALGFGSAWRENNPHAVWIYRAYIRYIGAGAVACAGVITLIKTIPTIVAAFRESFKTFGAGRGAAASTKRTERDLGMGFVLVGALAIVIILAVLPGFPHGPFPQSLLISLLIVVFGFFFVTVSSRIVGIIGSSSNPISGMTIATLMGTCVIFLAVGWRGDVYQSVALVIGAVVCVAAANAGATSQDLKTGYLVGATPRSQQIGLIIGVVASAFLIGLTVITLDRNFAEAGETHGIGSTRLPAPQATLMATMIKGLLAQNLPWAPVLVGVFLALMAQLAGAHPLSWAVGAYLPVSTTAPIWLGGMLKAMVDKWRLKREGAGAVESELSSGMLYSTGLVAGGALTGVLLAFLQAKPEILRWTDVGRRLYPGARDDIILGNLICAVAFGILCVLLVRAARKKLEV